MNFSLAVGLLTLFLKICNQCGRTNFNPSGGPTQISCSFCRSPSLRPQGGRGAPQYPQKTYPQPAFQTSGPPYPPTLFGPGSSAVPSQYPPPQPSYPPRGQQQQQIFATRPAPPPPRQSPTPQHRSPPAAPHGGASPFLVVSNSSESSPQQSSEIPQSQQGTSAKKDSGGISQFAALSALPSLDKTQVK